MEAVKSIGNSMHTYFRPDLEPGHAVKDTEIQNTLKLQSLSPIESPKSIFSHSRNIATNLKEIGLIGLTMTGSFIKRTIISFHSNKRFIFKSLLAYQVVMSKATDCAVTDFVTWNNSNNLLAGNCNVGAIISTIYCETCLDNLNDYSGNNYVYYDNSGSPGILCDFNNVPNFCDRPMSQIQAGIDAKLIQNHQQLR